MSTHQLAPGLVQIPLDPIAGINAYLVGDVLVDAGGRQHAKALLKAVAGRPVAVHALTHAHPDHQGSSKAVTEALGIPFAVPAGETGPAETGDFSGGARTRRAQWSARLFGGPGRPVDRALQPGDELGGFTVLALPGHSPGHVGYWREADRALVAGDALRNLSYATGRGRPALPAWFFNSDQDEVIASAQQIATLRPALLAFGHGRPVIGESAVQRFLERVASNDDLPALT